MTLTLSKIADTLAVGSETTVLCLVASMLSAVMQMRRVDRMGVGLEINPPIEGRFPERCGGCRGPLMSSSRNIRIRPEARAEGLRGSCEGC